MTRMTLAQAAISQRHENLITAVLNCHQLMENRGYGALIPDFQELNLVMMSHSPEDQPLPQPSSSQNAAWYAEDSPDKRSDDEVTEEMEWILEMAPELR